MGGNLRGSFQVNPVGEEPVALVDGADVPGLEFLSDGGREPMPNGATGFVPQRQQRQDAAAQSDPDQQGVEGRQVEREHGGVGAQAPAVESRDPDGEDDSDRDTARECGQRGRTEHAELRSLPRACNSSLILSWGTFRRFNK